MSAKVSIKFQGRDRSLKYPNKCPLCHCIIDVKKSCAQVIKNDNVQTVFICPNDECRNMFLGFYVIGQDGNLQMDRMEPYNVQIREFPVVIDIISSQFRSIYQEAEEARFKNLKQIAGAGYRKAVEFLIKDYAKHTIDDEQPDCKEKRKEIENKFAGQVIKDHIEDKRIQAVASRALWLGNDETHYLRIWEDHDIDDLINLIKLTVNWIEIEHDSAEYVKSMPVSHENKPN